MVKFKSRLTVGAINSIIWGCLVLLSVVNGYIWYSEEISNSYVIGVILACAGLIVLHRYFTREWCDNRDNGNYRDYDEEHPHLYAISMIISFIVLVVSLFLSISFMIGALTASLSFFAAFLREAKYT